MLGKARWECDMVSVVEMASGTAWSCHCHGGQVGRLQRYGKALDGAGDTVGDNVVKVRAKTTVANSGCVLVYSCTPGVC